MNKQAADIAALIGAELVFEEPQFGGFSSIKWGADKPVNDAVNRTIADTILVKNPRPVFVMFKPDYDIDKDQPIPRLLFWGTRPVEALN